LIAIPPIARDPPPSITISEVVMPTVHKAKIKVLPGNTHDGATQVKVDVSAPAASRPVPAALLPGPAAAPASPVAPSTPFNPDFGRILRAYRLSRDLTISEAGALCEIHPQHFGEVERGVREPSFATIRRIFYGLKLDPTTVRQFFPAVPARRGRPAGIDPSNYGEAGEFAFLFRRARTARGLTAAELADRWECAPEKVHTIERGVSAPLYRSLCRLVETVGIDPVELFPGDVAPEAARKASPATGRKGRRGPRKPAGATGAGTASSAGDPVGKPGK
jgi:transcriptional regulator with XRE-family HTH domain